LHLGTTTQSVTADGDRLALDLGGQTLTVSDVILGTGFEIELDPAGPLSAIVEHVARWQDRKALDDVDRGDELLRFPYLGGALEFTERTPGGAPWLANLHCFNHAAWLSHGYVSSDIPAVSEGGDRLARGVARSLFLADADHHADALHAYEEPELFGDELAHAAWWPPLPGDAAHGD